MKAAERCDYPGPGLPLLSDITRTCSLLRITILVLILSSAVRGQRAGDNLVGTLETYRMASNRGLIRTIKVELPPGWLVFSLQRPVF